MSNLVTTNKGSQIPKANQLGGSIFSSPESFDHGQRIAKMLASSDLVPKSYQGNVANTLVALNMANRVGSDPMTVMQNLNIIHGRPSWSSTFLISAINSSGRFGTLKFKKENLGIINHNGKQIENLACTAYARDMDGDVIEGTRVTIAMAIAEGWYGKSGSKWPNMPEQMLMYRAASFFSRVYCPEITMGMHTREEIEDTYTETVDGDAEVVDGGVLRELNDKILNGNTETVRGNTETVAVDSTESVRDETEAKKTEDWL